MVNVGDDQDKMEDKSTNHEDWEKIAYEFIEPFVTKNRNDLSSNNKERSTILLTYAETSDKCMSGNDGMPISISNPESMCLTHALRSENDTILVGVNTIILDNPSLTIRFVHHDRTGKSKPKNPHPIILDPNMKLSKLIVKPYSQENVPALENGLKCIDLRKGTKDKVYWIVNKEYTDKAKRVIEECNDDQIKKIVIIIGCPSTNEMNTTRIKDLEFEYQKRFQTNFQLDLKYLAKLLYQVHHVKNIMVEGGARTLSMFWISDLVDSIIVTKSDKNMVDLMGSNDSPPPTEISNAVKAPIPDLACFNPNQPHQLTIQRFGPNNSIFGMLFT